MLKSFLKVKTTEGRPLGIQTVPIWSKVVLKEKITFI